MTVSTKAVSPLQNSPISNKSRFDFHLPPEYTARHRFAVTQRSRLQTSEVSNPTFCGMRDSWASSLVPKTPSKTSEVKPIDSKKPGCLKRRIGRAAAPHEVVGQTAGRPNPFPFFYRFRGFRGIILYI